jgi:uncharacterized iron-regulated membrane protein
MKSKSNWKTVRKLFNNIHLWLGIAAGLVLFVVCLTGTIYTFRTEIEETIARDKFFVDVPENGKKLPADQLVELTKNEFPGHEVTSLTVPANPERAYKLYVRKEGERRGTRYLINPYTGEVLGDTSTSSSEFFGTVFRLHRWLSLDRSIGRPIVGWSTVIFVFLCLTGIVIWVPQKVKAWKQGLKIKWSGNWKRINHDLHNALGFYSVGFLLIMGLTGLQWSFDWYRTGLYDVLGVDRSGRTEEVVKPEVSYEGLTPITIEDALAQANASLDYDGNYNISLPGNETTSISLSKSKVGFFAPSGSDRLTLNKYTGEVEKLEIFSEKPFNERVGSSIKALHMGYVFGTFSKIIYFITCLIATSLPVTGTLIWINKLKKRRTANKKGRPSPRLVDRPGKLATA